jgi:hypothetical protein
LNANATRTSHSGAHRDDLDRHRSPATAGTRCCAAHGRRCVGLRERRSGGTWRGTVARVSRKLPEAARPARDPGGFSLPGTDFIGAQRNPAHRPQHAAGTRDVENSTVDGIRKFGLRATGVRHDGGFGQRSGRGVLSAETGVRLPYSLRWRFFRRLNAVVAHQVEHLASTQEDGVRLPATARVPGCGAGSRDGTLDPGTDAGSIPAPGASPGGPTGRGGALKPRICGFESRPGYQALEARPRSPGFHALVAQR